MKKPTTLLGYSLRVSSTRKKPCRGYITEVDNTLKALQENVGGRIGVVTLFDGVVLIFCEDGEELRYPLNRIWVSEVGEQIDYFSGNILAVRVDGDEFISIQEEDISKIDDLLPPYFDVWQNLEGKTIVNKTNRYARCCDDLYRGVKKHREVR